MPPIAGAHLSSPSSSSSRWSNNRRPHPTSPYLCLTFPCVHSPKLLPTFPRPTGPFLPKKKKSDARSCLFPQAAIPTPPPPPPNPPFPALLTASRAYKPIPVIPSSVFLTHPNSSCPNLLSAQLSLPAAHHCTPVACHRRPSRRRTSPFAS